MQTIQLSVSPNMMFVLVFFVEGVGTISSSLGSVAKNSHLVIHGNPS